VSVKVAMAPVAVGDPSPEGPDRGTVIVSIVTGGPLGPEGTEPPDGTGIGMVVVTPCCWELVKVTVTTGPAVAPGVPGAVITVDQEPGLPGLETVTVRTTVAVLLGPSGIVMVRTEPAEFAGWAGIVTVTPDVGMPGRGTVTVAPDPGMPGASGTVTVTTGTAGLPLSGEAVTVAPGARGALEPRGTVTVTTGTVTVLLGGPGSSVRVTVVAAAAPEEPWPMERSVPEEVQVEESRAGRVSAEPEDRPGSPGASVTVTTVAGPKVAIGVSRGTVTTTVCGCVVVLVQVESRST
jgi:hypothetical protein